MSAGAMHEADIERLTADLKALVRDSEELLKAGVGETTDQAREARARLQATIERAKAASQRIQEHTIAAAKATDRAIREHPYESIGVAFGVGLLIGVLVGRK